MKIQDNARLSRCIRAGRFATKRSATGGARSETLAAGRPGGLGSKSFGDAFDARGGGALPIARRACSQRWPGALFREHPRLGYDITWLSAHEEGHVDDHLLTAGRRNATERDSPCCSCTCTGAWNASAAGGGRLGRIPAQPAAHCRCAGALAGAHQQDAAAPVGPGSARTQNGRLRVSTPGRWRIASITTGHPGCCPCCSAVFSAAMTKVPCGTRCKAQAAIVWHSDPNAWRPADNRWQPGAAARCASRICS